MVVLPPPFENTMEGKHVKMRGKYTNGRDFDLRMRGKYTNGRDLDLRSGDNDEFGLENFRKASELDFFVLRMIEAPFTIRKNHLRLFVGVSSAFYRWYLWWVGRYFLPYGRKSRPF